MIWTSEGAAGSIVGLGGSPQSWEVHPKRKVRGLRSGVRCGKQTKGIPSVRMGKYSYFSLQIPKRYRRDNLREHDEHMISARMLCAVMSPGTS